MLKPNRGYGGAGVHLGRGAVAERMGSAARARRWPRSTIRTGSGSCRRRRRCPCISSPCSTSRAARTRSRSTPSWVSRRRITAWASSRASRRSRSSTSRSAAVSRPCSSAIGPRISRARRARPCRPDLASQELRAAVHRLRDLDGVIHLLEWDEETYRPRDAAEDRASQLAVLGALRHELLAGDRLGDLLAALAARARSHGARARGDRAARAAAAGGRRVAAESRRGVRRDALALPRGMGGGAARRRLRRVPESVRAAAEAHARAGGGAAVVRRPLRRAARRARARHAPRAPRPVAAGDGRAVAHARARARGAHAPLRAAAAARRLQPGAAAAVLCRAASRHGLRLRARPARPLDASVHDDGRRERRPRSRFARAPDDPLRAIFATLHEGGHALYDQGCRASCTARCSPTRRAWACTSRRRGSGRITSGAAPRSGGTTSRRCSARSPTLLGGLDARGFHRAINVIVPGVEPRRRRRGHLQPARARALRARDRAARRRARRRPTCRAPGTSATGTTSASAPRGRATAACRTCTGRSASSAISRPTRSAICTRRSSSTRTTRATTSTPSSRAATWARCAAGSPSSVYAHGAELPAEALIERITGRTLDVEPFFRRLERRVAELE